MSWIVRSSCENNCLHMNTSKQNFLFDGRDGEGLNRRQLMKMLGLGSAGAFLGGIGSASASPLPGGSAREDRTTPSYAAGLPPLTIKSVKAIATAPQGANLVLVK